MKKPLFLFSVLATFAILGCGNSDEMPCLICDGLPLPQYLSRSPFTLSLAGNHYGDLDAGVSYRQAQARPADIDIVAYYTGDADDIDDYTDDYILNPCYVPTLVNCGSPQFYDIPSIYWSELVNGQTTANIQNFLNAFNYGQIEGYGLEVNEIPITTGAAFFVRTTARDPYVVVIKSTGAESVGLEFFKLP